MNGSAGAASRIVVIVGASRGLGLAVAQQFAGRGDRLILAARPSARLDAAAAAMPDATVSPVDLADPVDIERMFAAIADKFDRVDTLILCAATGLPQSITELDAESVMRQFLVNAIAPVLCVKAALPLLRASEAADIIAISSESVEMPFPRLGIYAASKAALETAFAALRHELGRDHIRISIARVGQMIDTGFADQWDESTREALIGNWRESGHLAFAGEGMESSVVARALAGIVDLDRSARCDLLQIRSASSL